MGEQEGCFSQTSQSQRGIEGEGEEKIERR